jgi:hypothetical protein
MYKLTLLEGNVTFIRIISFFTMITILLNPVSGLSADWYNNFTIKELMFSQGAEFVRLTIRTEGGEGDNNPDGCDVGGVFIIPNTLEKEAQETAMLSGALTAFAAGNHINAYLMGCVSGIGGKSYPKIHFFYVSK